MNPIIFLLIAGVAIFIAGVLVGFNISLHVSIEKIEGDELEEILKLLEEEDEEEK